MKKLETIIALKPMACIVDLYDCEMKTSLTTLLMHVGFLHYTYDWS